VCTQFGANRRSTSISEPGFLSGHLGTKLGLHVKSFQRNGERVYSVRG
jgi:hypothetical protein